MACIDELSSRIAAPSTRGRSSGTAPIEILSWSDQLVSYQCPAEGPEVFGNVPPPTLDATPLVRHELMAPTTLAHPAIGDHLHGVVAIHALEIRQSRRGLPRHDEQESGTHVLTPPWVAIV